MAKVRSHSNVVIVRSTKTIDPRTARASEMWIREGKVPADYPESVLGSSREIIVLSEGSCISLSGNRAVKK